MRVLVTGGSGYLGGAIVRALVKHDHQPIVFARRATASGLPGDLIDGDIRERAAVHRAAERVDAIVHAAALVSLWQPDRASFEAINVGGLEVVLEVAKSLGTPRIVYTSSFLALPPAGANAPLAANDYQRTKTRALAVARAAQRAGQPVVILVPGVIYGPGVATEANLIGRLVSDHCAGHLPGIVGADRHWSYAYVDDVADAHVRALAPTLQGREYVIGGVNAPQIRVFEIVREHTGARLPRRIPFTIASAIAWIEEQRAELTRRPPLITRGAVEIFRHDWRLDSSRSVEELSYRIRPLEIGVKAMLSSGAD